MEQVEVTENKEDTMPKPKSVERVPLYDELFESAEDQLEFKEAADELYQVSLQMAELKEREAELKDRLEMVMGLNAIGSAASEFGTVSMVPGGERRSLDKNKMLVVFAKYKVPPAEMDNCMKTSKVKPSLRVAWRKE